ncbi:hypothetical protein BDA96_06G194600 [Sorghum bicolor]|uniref:Uncharacterized protein n=1 Tax=Sorghum bicolor TaxID=4558 RepID=A0A921QSH9_SORBI|nr:hypothetical protein BDA96_06G194600 [Sorghum bicolor]
MHLGHISKTHIQINADKKPIRSVRQLGLSGGKGFEKMEKKTLLSYYRLWNPYAGFCTSSYGKINYPAESQDFI